MILLRKSQFEALTKELRPKRISKRDCGTHIKNDIRLVHSSNLSCDRLDHKIDLN